MVVIIKYYLVDSENVNDNWLMLLDLSDETDKIIVFYTKNSPHMSYSSVIKLLGCTREIKFEECNEGNNALDFQLISYLGYLMKNEELKDSEFIVMSNDTGYDPAVNFWKKRGFPVNRINVNYCKLALQRKKRLFAWQNNPILSRCNLQKIFPAKNLIRDLLLKNFLLKTDRKKFLLPFVLSL